MGGVLVRANETSCWQAKSCPLRIITHAHWHQPMYATWCSDMAAIWGIGKLCLWMEPHPLPITLLVLYFEANWSYHTYNSCPLASINVCHLNNLIGLPFEELVSYIREGYHSFPLPLPLMSLFFKPNWSYHTYNSCPLASTNICHLVFW